MRWLRWKTRPKPTMADAVIETVEQPPGYDWPREAIIVITSPDAVIGGAGGSGGPPSVVLCKVAETAPSWWCPACKVWVAPDEVHNVVPGIVNEKEPWGKHLDKIGYVAVADGEAPDPLTAPVARPSSAESD